MSSKNTQDAAETVEPQATSDAVESANNAAATEEPARFSLSSLRWFEDDTKAWWRDRAIVVTVFGLLFLLFLGSFGLWDPWEVHYGEVARSILERNDWISTWWGSHWKNSTGSAEGSYFFSKPILLMWMMSIGMQVFGFSAWGVRLGVALIALMGVLLVYSMGASVFRRRVGFLMAGILGTSPFWSMLSRQAQTDMPFVGLMTVGICFFMMAVFGKDRDLPADKFSYSLTFGWVALVCIPQVILVLVGLSSWRGSTNPFMEAFTSPQTQGIIFGGVILGLGTLLLLTGLWKGRANTEKSRKTRSRLALAALAVVWVPLLVVLVIALVSGDNAAKSLEGWFVWGPTQAAQYLSMFSLALYLTFSRPIVERRRIYLIGFYTFVALATMAKGLLGFMLPGAIFFFYLLITREWKMLKQVDLHIGVPIFIAVCFPWYAAMLIRHTKGFWTRFFVHDHFKRLSGGVHQIDTGSFEHFVRWLGYGLFPWFAFLPATFGYLFSGRGLKMDDDRGRATLMLLIWAALGFMLFTLSSTKFHHYIFPVVPPLAMLIALAIDDALDRELPHPWPLYFAGIGVLGMLTWDLVGDPQLLKNLFTYKYDRVWLVDLDPGFSRWIFGAGAVSLVGMVLFLVRNRVIRRAGLSAVMAAAFVFTVFCIDIYMPAISGSWSQKGLWDAYYAQCTRIDGPPGAHRFKRFCEEPAIAFRLNWRGETFYTQNEVLPMSKDKDFDHFLKENGDETFYAIMEYSSYRGSFPRALPAHLKGKACITYNENIKFALVKVPCAPDDPNRTEDKPKNRR
ncbi:ArnT family glycosyltransferase [Bradymonas sediminis]|uniref:Glycosyltransferase RgtA/B/C/D-like domain-containing protein n=1 Tax=Bradymonas sediminis TaxID=1548548 RepID=A0A2Z4FJP0_9DELT|nr:glycosyltransferase family 39 protein [Bradymonas sediminis]AWV89080.1 hypothetical protein DN745_06920 [Bradymonas sediminis]TDP64456.1 dolichyl-phosphate-mannose-protein mannosyltransferase [Bradymonas sediminis]